MLALSLFFARRASTGGDGMHKALDGGHAIQQRLTIPLYFSQPGVPLRTWRDLSLLQTRLHARYRSMTRLRILPERDESASEALYRAGSTPNNLSRFLVRSKVQEEEQKKNRSPSNFQRAVDETRRSLGYKDFSLPQWHTLLGYTNQ